MKKITIAIDGYSSCGKSTVAKQLAKALDYAYVDSGAMYRAITLLCIRNKFKKWNDASAVKVLLSKAKISFKVNPKTHNSEIFLNGENVEKQIRSMEVSELVSRVSTLADVRKKLVAIQKESGKHKGVVMDGRDIGTVVFPDAELKVFMTAHPDIRAKRRFDELKANGTNVTLAEIKRNLEQRDFEDTHREDSPLLKAQDAMVLDNSEMTREQQLDFILDKVRRI